jgi:tetratricopeptide (TPR) repeat protein
VSGSVFLVGDTLRFLAQLTDVISGRVLRSTEEVRGPPRELSALLALVGERARAATAIQLDPKHGRGAVAYAVPPNLASYQAAVEGYEAYYRGNDSLAYALFTASFAQDRTYPTPLLLHAYVRGTQGELGVVDSLLRVADAIRSRFGPGERLLYENLRCKVSGDLPCRLRTATELMDVSPGPESPTLAAAMAVYLNRPREALAALRRTDPRRGLLLVNPTYWLRLTAAHHELGDFRREIDAATSALRQFPGNPDVEEAMVRALAAAGREREADHLVSQDKRVGDPRNVQRGYLAFVAYREYFAHGHPAAARRMVDTLRSIAVATAIDTSVESRGNRVEILYAIGEWRAALESLRQLTATTSVERIEWLGYHGLVAAYEGKKPLAELYADSLANLRKAYQLGENQFWRARILAVLGRPNDALVALTTAIGQGWTGWEFEGDGLHEEPDFASLRSHPAFIKLLTPEG